MGGTCAIGLYAIVACKKHMRLRVELFRGACGVHEEYMLAASGVLPRLLLVMCLYCCSMLFRTQQTACRETASSGRSSLHATFPECDVHGIVHGIMHGMQLAAECD